MGGFEKCSIGSETLKYKSPIPIPAEKSIENHEKIVKSGFALGPPRRNLPYLPKAIQIEKTMKTFTPNINNQPVFSVIICEKSENSIRTFCPPKMDIKTKQRIMISEG